MGNTILKKLASYRKKLQQKSASMIGYPINTSDEYRQLYDFFDYSLINLGDPFVPSNYRINSEKFEIEVLRFFAKLYKMPAHDFWGYITSGGTEGNTHGIFLGRQLYPDGLLYFSKDTHYSISKISRLLNMKTVLIESQPKGEMDYADFEKKLIQNKNIPAIINLNLGTTMKGAIDNIDTVVGILKRNSIHRYHIHCDAALSGMLLPFLKGAPRADFSLPIGSLAISGHKFIGTHIPCGITLCRKQLIKQIETPIEYIGSIDTTITGCRNGHTPLFLWYAIQKRGRAGFSKEANECIKNAQYLGGKLTAIHWPFYLNNYSNTVVFKKPPAHIVKKWQLAVCTDWAHIIVMQSVTKKHIDAFICDLMTSTGS